MRVMRLRLAGLVLSGGETGVGGAERVATCKSSDAGSCATAFACCDSGGVLGATVAAAFGCGGAMSAKGEVSSWPSRGLRLNRDLSVRC